MLTSYTQHLGEYAFSFYSVPTLVTAGAILAVGLLALVRERLSPVSLSFFLLVLTVSVWLGTYSILYSSANADTALLWARASFVGLPFIAPATYLFTVSVLRIYSRCKFTVWASLFLAAAFSATGALTDTIITGMHLYPWGYYPQYSAFGTLFVLFFIGMLISSMVHYRKEYLIERAAVERQHLRELNLKRISLLVTAFLIGYTGVFDFAPAYGIPLYPFGYLSILGFIVIAARTIWVYHFVDITPALAANQIIDTMDDALLVLDGEGVVQLVNKAAAEKFETTTVSLVGAPVVGHVPDQAFALQLRDLLGTDTTLSNYELNYNPPSGDGRILSLRSSVMKGRHGYPVATVGILSDVTEQKRWESALRDSEARFRLLFAGNPHSMWVYDNETLQFIEVNRAAMELYGYSRDEFLEFRITDMCHPDESSRLQSALADLKNGFPFPKHWRHRAKDGRVIDVELACQMFSLAGLDTTLVVGEDITKKKETDLALENSLSLLEATLEATADGILVINKDGRVAAFNQKFLELWRIPQSLVNSPDRDDSGLLSFVLDQLAEPETFLDKVEYLYSHPDEESYDVLRFKDGRYFERYSLPYSMGGEIGGRVWSFRDVTERQTLAEQLKHQAFHDPLTGLPNRVLFDERLKHALTRIRTRFLRREGAKNTGSGEKEWGKIAVIFVDLDNFKAINDTLGHKMGDRLLVAVSERFQACLRPSDTIARQGGDEFTILLEDITSISEVIKVSNRITEQMQAPIRLDERDKAGYGSLYGGEHQVFVSASIGIALQTSIHDNSVDLLRRADIAMYAAKRKGEGSYMVYEPKMSAHAKKYLHLENELRKAVEVGEFRVYYQPIVDLQTGIVEGVEALVRWEHPERGLIGPADFIEVAEHTRLIVPIGRIVLTEACRQLRDWHDQFSDGHAPLVNAPLTLSVNLSAVQFRHSQLLSDISNIVDESKLDPRHIKLEITESSGMDDLLSTLDTLEELKKRGMKLALDDFGTGYSALSYLKRFPIDILKLDKSFVAGLGQNSEDTAIVHATIAFAQALNLTVTAEGIETVEQMKHLRALGCNNGQGYLFAEPMVAANFNAFLASYKPNSLPHAAPNGSSYTAVPAYKGASIARRSR